MALTKDNLVFVLQYAAPCSTHQVHGPMSAQASCRLSPVRTFLRANYYDLHVIWAGLDPYWRLFQWSLPLC